MIWWCNLFELYSFQAALFFGMYAQFSTSAVDVHPVGEADFFVCLFRYPFDSAFNQRSQLDTRRSAADCPHFGCLLFPVQSLTGHDGWFGIFQRRRSVSVYYSFLLCFNCLDDWYWMTDAILGAMPFSLSEIRELASTLRDVCVGLVELAYPDCRPSTAFNFSKQSSSAVNCREDTRLWMHLFKVDMIIHLTCLIDLT